MKSKPIMHEQTPWNKLFALSASVDRKTTRKAFKSRPNITNNARPDHGLELILTFKGDFNSLFRTVGYNSIPYLW